MLASSLKTSAQSLGECNSAITKVLEKLVKDVDGIGAAVVATADGFALAAAADGTAGPERLAALTSSMFALAVAVAKELGLGELGSLVLEAAAGKVMMLTIPASTPLVLMVSCCDAALIGNVLWRAKQAAADIAKVA